MTNEKYNFGILGYGYVGKATHYSLLKDQSVVIHDKLLQTSLKDLADVNTIFICLPSTNNDDLKILSNEIEELVSQNPHCQIVIRSTLPVGYSSEIQNKLGIKIIYIPEFLRERYWIEDCLRRPLVVGKDDKNIPNWLANEEIIVCSVEEAELVKMFSNTFATVRIAFANLFYDLSQHMNADYDEVKNAFFKIQHDQTYMEVPGHDGTRGFGGKCLPKDLDFMIDSLDQRNLDSAWLKNIRELNKQWQKKF